MTKAVLPEQDYLLEVFSYNKANGTLTWRERPRHHFGSDRAWHIFNVKYAGRVISYRNPDGYLIVLLGKQRRMVHRIIWKMVTGSDPTAEVDHINHKPADNRWKNLRAATHQQNSRNMKMHKDNVLGVKGVQRRGGGFQARIWLDGKDSIIGVFATVEEAQDAYRAAALKFFGAFSAV